MAPFGVGLGPVPVFLRPGVVDHIAEVVVRFLVVRVRVGEVVLRELEDDGDQDEELPDHLIEQVPMKRCDLLPVLLEDPMLAHVGMRGNRLGDIQLCQLEPDTTYEGSDERTISTFSFTPVSPTQREFSRYPKYSPSAKLQGNRRFSFSGSSKKALPKLN